MTDIKILNDNFRKSFNDGKVLLTTGINAKRQEEIAEILNQVRCFNNFTKANDPYNEHDFGSFDYNGEKIFWKIVFVLFLIDDKIKNKLLQQILIGEYM